jgi:AraC-like DNA-binding protein
MAALGISMYFLASMKNPLITRQLHQSVAGTPLGNVTLGGVICDGLGIPRQTLRIYGQYALVYSLGDGEYRDSTHRRRRLLPGDLIVVFPDIAHQYGPTPGGHWNEIYVVFEGPLFDLWRDGGLLDPARPIYHLEPVALWRRRLEEIVAPKVPALERVCRLQTFLANLLTQSHHADAADQWLAQARALLAADLERVLYVDDVARRLGLSPETFRKKFTRLSGTTPWQYRLGRVIDHASRLVHEGQLTNKEIASRLGFSDEFHFSRRFKQIAGLSPTQFRALVPRARSGAVISSPRSST